MDEQIPAPVRQRQKPTAVPVAARSPLCRPHGRHSFERSEPLQQAVSRIPPRSARSARSPAAASPARGVARALFAAIVTAARAGARRNRSARGSRWTEGKVACGAAERPSGDLLQAAPAAGREQISHLRDADEVESGHLGVAPQRPRAEARTGAGGRPLGVRCGRSRCASSAPARSAGLPDGAGSTQARKPAIGSCRCSNTAHAVTTSKLSGVYLHSSGNRRARFRAGADSQHRRTARCLRPASRRRA